MTKKEYAKKLKALQEEYIKSHFKRGDKVNVLYKGQWVLAYIFYRDFIFDDGRVNYVLYGTKNGEVDKTELFASGTSFSDDNIRYFKK